MKRAKTKALAGSTGQVDISGSCTTVGWMLAEEAVGDEGEEEEGRRC